MYVVLVHVSVMPAHRDEFIDVTLENARNTVQEPGSLRFDVLQDLADENRFTLVEVYRNEQGMAAHKETSHYAAWRDAVEPWMAGKRVGVKYASLFPESAEAWATVCS